MANNNNNKKQTKPRSPLVGNQAKPTVLDSTTKLDIDINKTLIDSIIGAGLSGGLDVAELENFTSISNSRDQVYQLIDTMAKDASVSAILRTYSEDVCESADNGHIIWCESQDPNISKFVNYLLNVMNADKNIYSWAYCLLKYGDVYLRLYRESDYDDTLFKKDKVDNAYSARNVLNEDVLKENVNLSIHSVNDPYSYYVEMVPDPSTMFELTKYGKTYGYIEVPNAQTGFDTTEAFTGVNGSAFNYKLKSADVNVYQADDFVHACLDDNFTRYPESVNIFLSDEDYKTGAHSQNYLVRRGKSLLFDSYKTWREKSLLENAALLNRITRSSMLRNVTVEVGDMSKEQVQQTLRRIKSMIEQKTSVNVGSSMTEYPNPGPMENIIYTATHNGQGAITINSVGGDIDVKNLADLDLWNNKFYSAYGIPKQYFGWTDDGAGFNGGTSLTILSSVYSKGVKRVQNALIQAITDIINLILINRGCKSYLNNFNLKMKAPLTQEELDYRANMSDRISAISNMNSLFADVEDKGRRLTILKSMVSTLNYGDDIIAQLNEEIKAVEEAKKKAEEEAEQKAKDEAAAAEATAIETPTEEPMEEPEDEMPELPAVGATGAAEESFATSGSTILTEDQIVESDDDLPNPDEISGDIDFSKNN